MAKLHQRISAAALAALLLTSLAACKPATAPADQQFAEIVEAGALSEVLWVELTNLGEDNRLSVGARQPDGSSLRWTWLPDGDPISEPLEPSYPGPGVRVDEVDLAALVSAHDRYRGDDCAEPTAHLQTSPIGGQLGWASCGTPQRYLPGSATIDGAPVAQDSFDLSAASDIATLAEFLPQLLPNGELVELTHYRQDAPALTGLAPSISLPGGYCQPAWVSLATGGEQGEGFSVRVECRYQDGGFLTPAADPRPAFSLADYDPAAIVAVWQQISAAGMTEHDVAAVTYTADAGGGLTYTVTPTDPYRFDLLTGTIEPR